MISTEYHKACDVTKCSGALEGILDFLNYKMSSQESDELSCVPFSEEQLIELRDEYMLVPTLDMSIREILHLAMEKGLLNYPFDLYENKWLDERSEAGWHLLARSALHGSERMSWNQQLRLLGREDRIPKASVVIMAAIINRLVLPRHFLDGYHVRTSSLYGDYHVSVGPFNYNGLVVGSWNMYAKDRCLMIITERVP